MNHASSVKKKNNQNLTSKINILAIWVISI